MVEGKEIELINLLWGILVIPAGYLIKLYMNNKETKRKANEAVAKKALASLTKDEIRELIREEILPVIKKQSELESDFKEVNKDFIRFTESFYAKMSDITLRVLGK